MADIELVIKIPKEYYNYIKNISDYHCTADMLIIKNGTPLTKGHGDLIDVDRKITVPVYDEEFEEYEDKVMTVLEALNRWSEEGVTVKDVIVKADK